MGRNLCLLELCRCDVLRERRGGSTIATDSDVDEWIQNVRLDHREKQNAGEETVLAVLVPGGCWKWAVPNDQPTVPDRTPSRTT